MRRVRMDLRLLQLLSLIALREDDWKPSSETRRLSSFSEFSCQATAEAQRPKISRDANALRSGARTSRAREAVCDRSPV